MKNFQGNNRGQGGYKGGNRQGGGQNFRRDDRGFDRPQLHHATCVECGNGCEVPFKPNGSKPVYCRDCFKKDGDSAQPKRFGRDDRGFERDRKPMFRTDCASCGDSCEVPFKPNGSKPVYCRNCFDRNGDTPSVTRYERKPAASAPAPDRYADEFRSLHAKLDMLLKAVSLTAPAKEIKKAVVSQAVEAPVEMKPTKAAKTPAKKKAPAKKKTAAKKK